MAVVGHAYVVVRALTDKVDADIRKGFSGSAASANRAGRDIGNNLADGISRGVSGLRFDSISDQFKNTLASGTDLADGFTSLARKGYFVQSGFGAIVGSIGALVGGLGAVAGAAGGAAGALVAVGGAALTAKAGLAIAGFALKGVGQAVSAATKANGGYSKSFKEIAFDAEAAALSVDRAAINLENAREAVLRTQDLPAGSRVRREAELAYKEAELAYRRAQDAKKQGGKDDGGGGGGADAFAGLTPSQKAFAKYLISLQPLMEKLREAAAKGFLPLLQTQMEKLVAAKLPEILEEKFFKLGEAAGKAVEKFTDIFLSGDNLTDFSKILDNMAEDLPKFGTILGNVFSGFLSILESADPLTKRFIGFLESKSQAFRDFLDTKQATGELETFFNKAGDLAARFGGVFGNIFGAFGKIIQANFGPGSGGDTILTWLEKVTQGWEDMDLISLQGYFKGAADNFVAMGDAMGGAIETVIKAGADPAIKEFWNILDTGSYAFKQIVDGSVEAAPALAKFLKAMTEIIAVFTDSGQVKAFFDTLTFFAQGAAEALKALKPLIDFVGPIFATISAIGLLQGALFKMTAIFVGFGVKAVGALISITSALGLQGIAGGLARLVPAAAASGTAMTLALGPVGVAIAAVTAAVIGLVAAFAGIHAAQMEKATKGVAQGFKDGADAATLWGQATLAVADGPAKQIIGSVDGMKAKMGQLAAAQKSWTNALPSTTAMADSFGAMGRTLADVATNDVGLAQKQFKSFTSEVGFSNTEIQTALNEMDEYKSALIEQADQMGINIRTLQGDIDMQKLANFAVGEGEIAQRKANEAKQEAVNKLAEVARGFVDYQGALNQNKEDTMAWAKAQAKESGDATDSWKDYWDGQSFSMEKYLDDLEAQVTAARNWQSNIALLSGKLDDAVLAEITNMGEAGSQLVASLVDGVNDKEEIARLNNIGVTSANALYTGAQNALSNRPPLQLPYSPVGYTGRIGGRKDGGYIQGFMSGGLVTGPGTARSDSIPAMLSNGEFVINARATAQNRQLLEAINNNKSIPTGNTITMNVYSAPGMDEKELAEVVSRKIAFAMTKGGY